MRSWFLGALLVTASAFTVGQLGCATSIDTSGNGGAGGGNGGESPSPTSSSSSSASSSAGQPGTCVTAMDCPSTGDVCNTPACINGKCSGLPTNEMGSCEDGKQCTQNDTCHDGVCVGGSQIFCPASDTCHVGTCDLATDTCTEIPGNDGASCNDNDACTLPGSCSNGTCLAGGQVDCSFLNGTCSIGFCDPTIGCKVMAQNDGTACDDGKADPCKEGACMAGACNSIPANEGGPCDDKLFCTIGDHCQSGTCVATGPNTCAPPGDVCKIGTCDEATKKCVAVPGNDGAACEDGNFCTGGEKCLNGNCVGGVPANNGVACEDGNGCTLGTQCTNGVCGNPQSMIVQCINNDSCCPAGCQGNDNDCQVCHPIIGPPASMGAPVFVCPSGATQFCVPPPLSPSNPAHAKAACEACYGVPCFEELADCAGPGYGPNPPGQYIPGNAYFGYTSGCSGDDGRAWSIGSSFTTYGYWGK